MLEDLYSKNLRDIEESTIYSTALGAPVESNIAFSTVSLLAQQGRLPLSGPQGAVGKALSSMIYVGLEMLAEGSLKGYKLPKSIDVKKLPLDLVVDVKVDIKLPQDRLQMANVANLLADKGLADHQWIQESILNISNAKEVRKNVIKDKAIQIYSEARLQKLVAETMQSQAPQPNEAGVPGQPAPMGSSSGQPGRPPQDAMNFTGTPPEGMIGVPAAQGGMLPSQGQGVVPEALG